LTTAYNDQQILQSRSAVIDIFHLFSNRLICKNT
jgi:hypothetical protein